MHDMIVVHNALEPAFFETVSEYALNQKYCHEQLLLSSVSEQMFDVVTQQQR
jgi:hypothetical protein